MQVSLRSAHCSATVCKVHSGKSKKVSNAPQLVGKEQHILSSVKTSFLADCPAGTPVPSQNTEFGIALK